MSLHIASYTRDWYRYCVIVVRLMIIIEILKYSKICYLCEKCHQTLYHRMMSSHQFRELVFTIHRLFISVDIMQHYTILYTMYSIHRTTYTTYSKVYMTEHTWFYRSFNNCNDILTLRYWSLCEYVHFKFSSRIIRVQKYI